MDELRAIRSFLTVAERRSFASAARRLGLTPAAVTRDVAALEATLGTQLLVRTTRQVSLTSAGAVYAARVAPMIEGLAAARTELADQQAAAFGLIRLNAPLSLGLRVLPPILADFRAAYPGIELSVRLSDRFMDILRGEADLAIRISEPPTDKSTIWRKICHVERVLVAAPGMAAADLASPDDLRPQDCLAYDAEGGADTWQLSNGPRRRVLRAGARFSANNGDLLARMAETGAGVALLPRFIVADALESGRLVRILPDWRPPDIWLTLYFPPYDRLPPRVATFSDFFERHVTERAPLSALLSAPINEV
jgi:DNA-binding transcriptional LysR family regulator